MAAKKRAVVRLSGGRSSASDAAANNAGEVGWLKAGTGYSSRNVKRVSAWDSGSARARAVNNETGEIMKGERLRGWLSAGGRVSAVGYDG
jgi:hypothetical protein